MRLTLRTLLAYLDDTLDPTEIKQIGQKVAESDAAQELVARIKQVTRRRRLTTPPPSGPHFDPNTIAEYLDNELPPEQVAEVEKVALESDVHLAEIAACHQILTLVLGEPALVPPTARERMYALVRGREAIPSRRAPVGRTPVPTGDRAGEEDSSLLGLPSRRTGSPLVWALPLAGVLLCLALVAALMQAWSGNKPERQVAGAGPRTNAGQTPESSGKKGPEETKPAETKPAETKPTEDARKQAETKGTPPVKPPEGERTTATSSTEGKPSTKPLPPPPSDSGPSPERVEVGQYAASGDLIPALVRHELRPDAPWVPLQTSARVSTGDLLVSLPGYASEVHLDNGVRLLLRGSVREFARNLMMENLLGSAAVLHRPAQGLDLDVSLERGRFYLTNRKETGAARVRLRFAGQVWDLSLDDRGSEVIIDLISQYDPTINWRAGQPPLTQLFLTALSGKASVRLADSRSIDLQGPPGPALLAWQNMGESLHGPERLEKVLPVWDRNPPDTDQARQMTVALKDLKARLSSREKIDLALLEGLDANRPPDRLLAIYCLCALDDVARLVDRLGDEDQTHAQDRDAAVFALRRWISRGPEQALRLYNPSTHTGVLLDSKLYRAQDAERIVALLHDFSDVERRQAETFEVLALYLRDTHVAIRELAWWHLFRMAAAVGVRLPPFDADAPSEQRQRVSDDVLQLVKEGKLPGSLPSAPPVAGAGTGSGTAPGTAPGSGSTGGAGTASGTGPGTGTSSATSTTPATGAGAGTRSGAGTGSAPAEDAGFGGGVGSGIGSSPQPNR